MVPQWAYEREGCLGGAGALFQKGRRVRSGLRLMNVIGSESMGLKIARLLAENLESSRKQCKLVGLGSSNPNYQIPASEYKKPRNQTQKRKLGDGQYL